MKGPPLGWQLQAVPCLQVKMCSLAVPFSRSPRQLAHRHSTLLIPVSAVQSAAGILWPVQPYPLQYTILLAPTVHSTGAATSGLFCRVVSLASPHRSPAVGALCCSPCIVIHLLPAVPMNPHPVKSCLESDAFLFKSFFNIGIRLTMLQNRGRIVMVKIQRFTSSCDLLSPCFLDNHPKSIHS